MIVHPQLHFPICQRRYTFQPRVLSIIIDALLLLGLVLLVEGVVVGQPAGEHLLVDLVREDLALEVVAVLGDPRLVLLVQLHLEVPALLLVVPLEGHPVEVESLAGRQVDVVALFSEGLLDGLLALEPLVADLDEQADHLADLVVDEALADESEADEGHAVRRPLLLALEPLLQVLPDHLLLHHLRPHRHHVAVASRVRLLVPLREVVEVVRAQVELGQPVELAEQLLTLELVEDALLVVLGEEEAEGGDVVVDAGGGVVAHVEALADLLDGENADVEGQFCVDVPRGLLEVDDLVLAVEDVAVVELEAHRDAVAQRVHPLVRASRPRPLDAPQVRLVGLQHEAVLAEHAVQDVLDGIGSVALVLQPQEALPVVPEEDPHLHLQTLAARRPLLVRLHVKEQC